MQEINTGVYVGHLSARVRDQIWAKVQEHAKTGRATMVYGAHNEQRMDFRVHNTAWQPIDFDGLKLMMRPHSEPQPQATELKGGFSKVAKNHQANQASRSSRRRAALPETYAVVDVETTGLNPTKHEIIELAAIVVDGGRVTREFQALIRISGTVPPHITTFTSITNEMLVSDGRPLTAALRNLLDFLGDLPIVSHNADFDYGFIRAACERNGIPLFANRCIDTLALARRLVENAANHKLGTLLAHFGLDTKPVHRGSSDCVATKALYEKLIEIHRQEI